MGILVGLAFGACDLLDLALGMLATGLHWLFLQRDMCSWMALQASYFLLAGAAAGIPFWPLVSAPPTAEPPLAKTTTSCSSWRPVSARPAAGRRRGS